MIINFEQLKKFKNRGFKNIKQISTLTKIIKLYVAYINHNITATEFKELCSSEIDIKD